MKDTNLYKYKNEKVNSIEERIKLGDEIKVWSSKAAQKNIE